LEDYEPDFQFPSLIFVEPEKLEKPRLANQDYLIPFQKCDEMPAFRRENRCVGNRLTLCYYRGGLTKGKTRPHSVKAHTWLHLQR
jgi:hypothetical protein